MDRRLPFTISTRPWLELSERERSFFCGDDCPPLPSQHAAQIGLLAIADADRLATWVFSAIPPGWPDRTEARFEYEDQLNVSECWNEKARGAGVKRWLFDQGVPFRRTVYLLYAQHQVVETT